VRSGYFTSGIHHHVLRGLFDTALPLPPTTRLHNEYALDCGLRTLPRGVRLPVWDGCTRYTPPRLLDRVTFAHTRLLPGLGFIVGSFSVSSTSVSQTTIQILPGDVYSSLTSWDYLVDDGRLPACFTLLEQQRKYWTFALTRALYPVHRTRTRTYRFTHASCRENILILTTLWDSTTGGGHDIWFDGVARQPLS